MAERILKVTVVGDARGLHRSLDQAEGKAKRFGGAMGKLGGAMAGAFAGAAIISGIQGFVAEARSAQVVGAQTDAVIKSTGGAANLTAKQFGDLAGAISAKVAVDDEVIQSGQNILATFTSVRNETGRGNDIFNQATTAAVDLAAAMNGGEVTAEGLKSANLQLGKALNDPVKGMGALRRVGVAFTAEQKDQIETMVESGNVTGAQKVILGELKTEFGGAAAAAATSGKRLQVAWGNIQEQLGTILLPILDKVAGWLLSVLPAAISVATRMFGALTSAFQSGAASGTGLTAVFARVGATARTLWNGLSALVTGFREGQATSGGFTGAMQLLGAGLRAVAGWIGRNTGLISTLAIALGVALAAVKAWQIATTVFGSVSAAIGGVQTAYRVLIGVQAGVRAAIAGTTVAQSAGTAATMANAVAVYAQTAASKVAAVAARVWAVAQAALNLVLTANPIALVVLAVAALVAGFIVAYRTSATFRAVVAAAWAGIKAAAAATVSWLTGTAWPAIQTVWRAIATGATWLWRTIIVPAWNGISAIIRVTVTAIRAYWTGVLQPVWRAIATAAGWLWRTIITPAFRGIAAIVRLVFTGIRTYWTSILQPVLRAIATVVNWLWRNIIELALLRIRQLWKITFTTIRFLWTSILQPTLRAIATGVNWLWHNIIVPAFNGIRSAIRTVFNAIRVLWTGTLQPTLRAIAAGVGWLWHNIIVPAFNAIRTAIAAAFRGIQSVWRSVLQTTLRAIASVVGWLWHNIVTPAFNGIRTAIATVFRGIQTAYRSVLKPTFDAAGNAITALRGTFARAVDGIRAAWARVRDAVKGPIRFVIETVLNQGLIGAWNWVSDKILAGKFHVPNIPLPKGFAGGGGVPGTGPNRDTVPAMLTPGEFVLNRRMVAQAGGLGRLESWRQQARTGFMNAGGLVQQLARGGVVGNIGGLNAAFMGHLRMYSDAINTIIDVTSGFRTRAEQAALYARKPNLAAPPGRSLHELGIAADIVPQLGGTKLGRRAGAYGLAFPMSYEPWHIQMAGGRAAAGKGGGGIGGFVSSLVPDVVKKFAAVSGMLRGTSGLTGAVAHRLIDLVTDKAKDAAANLFSSQGGGGGLLRGGLLTGGGGLSAAERWIIQRESGGRTNADNPTSTAFGLGQLLLANRQHYGNILRVPADTQSYADQLKMFRMYVRDRYGNAENAQRFWQAHGWYNKGGPVGGMVAGGKVGKLGDMGPDAGPQPGYLGGSAFTTAHLLSRMTVAQRSRMFKLFGAPTAPAGYQWNKWGRLTRDRKFLGVPDAPATGRFARPGRLKGSAFTVNHLLGRMRPAARSKYLYYNTLPPAPAGYRWNTAGRLVIDTKFKGRRARPGDRPASGGSAFTVNDTLSRMAPAYRDAYLRQHTLPAAPSGWSWSGGRLIRTPRFKGKLARPAARNAGGAIPFRAFDKGGSLPPHSLTLAANNTSKYEPVGPPGAGRGSVVFEAGSITIPVTAAPGQSEARVAELVDERLAAGLGRVLGHVRARRAR